MNKQIDLDDFHQVWDDLRSKLFRIWLGNDKENAERQILAMAQNEEDTEIGEREKRFRFIKENFWVKRKNDLKPF